MPGSENRDSKSVPQRSSLLVLRGATSKNLKKAMQRDKGCRTKGHINQHEEPARCTGQSRHRVEPAKVLTEVESSVTHSQGPHAQHQSCG